LFKLNLKTIFDPDIRFCSIYIEPFHDELLSSWLTRCAIAHDSGIFTFSKTLFNSTNIWNRDLDYYLPEHTLIRISDVLEVNLSKIQNMLLSSFEGTLYFKQKGFGATPWVRKVGVYHRTRKIKGQAICVSCLKNDPVPYFRQIWRLNFYTDCESCRVKMIQECPVCNSPIVFFRNYIGKFDNLIPRITQCHNCRFDLVKARKERSSVIHLSKQMEISNIYRAGFVNNIQYSALYFDVLRQIMYCFRSVYSNSKLFRQSAYKFLNWEEPESFGSRFSSMEVLPIHEIRRLIYVSKCFLDKLDSVNYSSLQLTGISSSVFRDFDPIPYWFEKNAKRCFYQNPHLKGSG